MAKEASIVGNIHFVKGRMDVELGSSFRLTIAGTQYVKYNQNITQASEIALELGTLDSLGYAIIKNLDPTNFFTILTGTSGTVFAKVLPLGFALFHFGSGVTAPFALADTADCEAEILILEP